MSDSGLYDDLFFLCLYFGGLWITSWICRLIKVTPIVGQILYGIILGPNVLDFVPLFNGQDWIAKHEEHYRSLGMSREGNATNDPEDQTKELEENLDNFLVILGQLGVTFLIFESGLHVDFATLKRVGGPAMIVAVLGTVLSFGVGIGLSALFGFGAYPEGLAVGAVIAPTSVGIALKLLHDANVLDSTFGQTIVTAAFTDDIFSLITLAVLVEIASGQFSTMGIIKPLLYNVSFITVGFLLAIYIFPSILPPVFSYIAERSTQGDRDNVHLLLIFLCMAGFGYIGSLIGSHLLGAFLTGVVFSRVPRTNQIWANEMGVVNNWLIAIFFGATVAFAVPIDEMLDLQVFWKGLIVGVLCILAKVFSGFALNKRWVVGWAMVGRGEFSFLVGETLEQITFQDTNKPFLSSEAFAIAVWGLMIAIFVAPVAFGYVLSKQLQNERSISRIQHYSAEPTNNDDNTSQKQHISAKSSFFSNILFRERHFQSRVPYSIFILAPPQQGLARDVMIIFEEMNCQVEAFQRDGNIHETDLTFSVLVPSLDEDMAEFKDPFYSFNIDKYLERLQAKILAAINDQEYAEVKIVPKEEDKRNPVRSVRLSLVEIPVDTRNITTRPSADGRSITRIPSLDGRATTRRPSLNTPKSIFARKPSADNQSV